MGGAGRVCGQGGSEWPLSPAGLPFGGAGAGVPGLFPMFHEFPITPSMVEADPPSSRRPRQAQRLLAQWAAFPEEPAHHLPAARQLHCPPAPLPPTSSIPPQNSPNLPWGPRCPAPEPAAFRPNKPASPSPAAHACCQYFLFTLRWNPRAGSVAGAGHGHGDRSRPGAGLTSG